MEACGTMQRQPVSLRKRAQLRRMFTAPTSNSIGATQRSWVIAASCSRPTNRLRRKSGLGYLAKRNAGVVSINVLSPNPCENRSGLIRREILVSPADAPSAHGNGSEQSGECSDVTEGSIWRRLAHRPEVEVSSCSVRTQSGVPNQSCISFKNGATTSGASGICPRSWVSIIHVSSAVRISRSAC